MFGRWRRKRAALRFLEEDIRQHIAEEVQDNIARGMSPADARSAAMRRFGNVALTKEDTRAVWARVWLEQAIRDVRFAFRTLVKKPLFVVVAAATIALGIGAATVVFSIVDSVLLRPLPYRDPDDIVLLLGGKGLDDPSRIRIDDLARYRDQGTALEGLAFYGTTRLESPGHDAPVAVAEVEAGVFDVLGVRPLIGSVFPWVEDSTEGSFFGRPSFVVLSYGFWQTRFGGDPDVVGQTISLSGLPHEIVGAMPRGFFFPEHDVQLWRPLGLSLFANAAVGRLKADTPLEAAQAEIDVISSRLDEENSTISDSSANPGDDRRIARLYAIHEVVVNDYRAVLWALMGAVGLVLLIACANVANLLLAQGVARGGELALRTALGAGRMALIRQLVTESLLVSVLAGTMGVGLAFIGLPFLLNLGLVEIPRLETASISVTVLLFATAASVFAGLLAGLTPAWRASRPNLTESLDSVGHAPGAARGGRLRDVIVVGEIALALVLLIGGGLLVRSAIGLSRIDWGFDPNDLGVVAVRPGVGLHPLRSSRADQAQFASSVLERLGGFPDIQAVGVTNMAPLIPSGGATVGERVIADGRPLTTAVTASRAVVSGGYFGALGMEVRGRAFNESDDALGPKVAVLSESLARELFRGAEPIGQTVHFAALKDAAIESRGPETPVFDMIAVGGSVDIGDFEITGQTAHTVIGVANDIRLSGDPTAGGSGPTVYLDYRQHDRPLDPVTRGFLAGTGSAGNPDLLATFVVRATGDDPQAAIEATKRAVGEVQPSLSFQEAAAMDQLISRALGGAGQSRLLLVLSTAFGVLALLLAGAGVYGVVAHRVAQRTCEIGIRLAVGARRLHIVGLICQARTWFSTSVGLVLGLAGAVAGSRMLESWVFGITTTDAFTFAGVTILLALVALAASLIPAIRATRVDPAVTTREA